MVGRRELACLFMKFVSVMSPSEQSNILQSCNVHSDLFRKLFCPNFCSQRLAMHLKSLT